VFNRRKLLSGLGAGAVSLATSWPHRLSWAADGAPKGQLRFAFFTDVHARTEWGTPVAMAKAARTINAQKPDLVIAGGDLITDGFTSLPDQVAPRWDVYMKMHNAIDGDVHATIGNHDLVAANPADGSKPSADPRAEFRSRLKLDRTYYSFDALGYRVFVLDSINVIRGKLHYQGLIGPAQMEWLSEELLKTPKDMPIVMVSHIPLLTAFFGATRGALEGGKPNFTGAAGSFACSGSYSLAQDDLYYRWGGLRQVVAWFMAWHGRGVQHHYVEGKPCRLGICRLRLGSPAALTGETRHYRIILRPVPRVPR